MKLFRLTKEETGVTVIVDTAANNTYESTLAARMGTSEAPTIFQINDRAAMPTGAITARI